MSVPEYARDGVMSESFESRLVLAATAPRPSRPTSTPAAAARPKKANGRRRANRLTSSNTSLASWLSSQCAISPPLREAWWARSVTGPDSSELDAMAPSSFANPCRVPVSRSFCVLPWLLSSSRAWLSRDFAWVLVSATTFAASSFAVPATCRPASVAVSFTCPASSLAASRLPPDSDPVA